MRTRRSFLRGCLVLPVVAAEEACAEREEKTVMTAAAELARQMSLKYNLRYTPVVRDDSGDVFILKQPPARYDEPT